MQISLTKLNNFTQSYLQCPNCNGDIKSGVTFYSGASLFLNEQSSRKEKKEPYWGSVLTCLCPKCTADLYALEIAVLSHPVKGREFIQDNYYDAQFIEVILVETGSWEWVFERHINIQFERMAGHDYAGESMPSMDIHLIGLFAEAEDIFKTVINAEKMYKLFLPYIKHIQQVKLATQ